jgi:hypothetical protein
MKIADRIICLAAVVCSAATVLAAAEAARWVAGGPPTQEGLTLKVTPECRWHNETSNGKEVARLQPAGDYYTQAEYVLTLDRAVAGPVYLVIEFLDRGYGLANVTPRVAQAEQWGVARVNTGRWRRTVLRYKAGALKDSIRIANLDFLHSVRLTTERPEIDPVPLVDPGVHFGRESQRVMPALGDDLTPDQLPEMLATLRNVLPLVRALGFNGVESFVRWGFAERRREVYDWSFYDAIAGEIERHGLKWFPMLLAGSGYALPDWLHQSKDDFGFVCLEHGLRNDTQSIFDPFQAEYARRFIQEFGKHYGGRNVLLGIRLGPSGDYGEAQYPARGPGFRFRRSHTHIGFWAGDERAQADFRGWLRQAYPDIAALNKAWEGGFASFDEIRTFLPDTARTRRQRLDFANWYMGAMSKWCENWAVWSRAALPGAVIHQSSGGWGPVEIGTDYSYQARSMARVSGGIRLTNESDNFPDNFTITRMASSAARFYGAALGYEPGGYGSQRGVVARLFNAITTGADHLFYYHSNLLANDYATDAWLRLSPLLDQRAKPVVDVAAFYPDTAQKLDNDVLRWRFASSFFTMARALRAELDYDYASEQMIADGALEHYKVLVFLWGHIVERGTLERVDRWLRDGGTVIYPMMPRGLMQTVEGDTSVMQRWLAGDTGKGKAVFWRGDSIPPEFYTSFLRKQLLGMNQLHPWVQAALRMERPAGVYWSVLESGKVALLNFSDEAATVRMADGRSLKIKPYEIALY